MSKHHRGPKFYPGDIVRCVNSSDYRDTVLSVGDVLEVSAVIPQVDGEPSDFLEFRGGNILGGLYAHRFELVEQKPEDDTPAHYASPIQVVDFIKANGLNFDEGNVIKYVTRYRKKGGINDLRKAEYYLKRLIDEEASKQP